MLRLLLPLIASQVIANDAPRFEFPVPPPMEVCSSESIGDNSVMETPCPGSSLTQETLTTLTDKRVHERKKLRQEDKFEDEELQENAKIEDKGLRMANRKAGVFEDSSKLREKSIRMTKLADEAQQVINKLKEKGLPMANINDGGLQGSSKLKVEGLQKPTGANPNDERPQGVSKLKKEEEVGSKRLVKRQVGRATMGGCGNEQLSSIMQHVVGPLLSVNQIRLGDKARILQNSVQQATGKSHEILMGKGEMQIASHQMDPSAACRLRIGDYYTSVHETPVQYNVNDVRQEQILQNIDYGEPLGGTGYEGQLAWPLRVYNPIEGLFDGIYGATAGECFSGDLLVETIAGKKRMSELKAGDEVLSAEEGIVSFSPIILFLHRDEERVAEFNVITTANGDTVKLTNEHLIYAYDCEHANTLRAASAREITTDHCIMAIQPNWRALTITRVTNVTKVAERGIYSPLTATGDIIVNNVLSSCHSNLAMKTLQQTLFTVYRYLSFLLPKREGALPFGLAYLTNSLDLFVPNKAHVI